MNDIRRWMAWTEERLAILMIQEGLAVGLAQAIQGPMTVTFRLRLLQPSKSSLAKLLSLGSAIGQALQTSQARISDTSRGVLIEIPSPQPRTPGAELLARKSLGLSVAIGLNSFREPVCFDFQRWPHLLAVGPTRRGKSQALRSILYALARVNPPNRLRYLILAKKREDWLAFQPAASCYGLLIEPEEQEQALAWLAKEELEQRAATGRKRPALFLIADDLRNISARASLAGYLGEIASMGGAAGIHLLLGTQTTGRAGGLTQDLEQNLTARLIFGAADAAAGARYAGSGGFQIETVGQAPGDSLLILDGQPERVATGLCQDTAIAQLPGAELAKPWQNSQEQAGTGRTGQPASSSRAMTVSAREESDGEQASEQASQNSLRLDASRSPTAAEREQIRLLYQETGSKKQTVLRAYGFYNGKTFGFVSEALEEPASQQNGIGVYQDASKPAEASRMAQENILEPDQAEIDLTTEAGRELLAELGSAGLLQWPGQTARVIQ